MSIQSFTSAIYFFVHVFRISIYCLLPLQTIAAVSIIYDNPFGAGLDPGFGIISSVRKFSGEPFHPNH